MATNPNTLVELDREELLVQAFLNKLDAAGVCAAFLEPLANSVASASSREALLSIAKNVKTACDEAAEQIRAGRPFS